MVRIYEATGDGRGPWTKGDRVAYSPFRKESAVVVIYRVGLVTEFGRNLVPAVRKDATTGALRLVEEHLDPQDKVFLSQLPRTSANATSGESTVPELTVF
jgi:hypothetical protein